MMEGAVCYIQNMSTTQSSHALVEVGTNILITLHDDLLSIYALEAHTPDTLAIANVTIPFIRPHVFGRFLGSKTHPTPREYPRWSLSFETRTLSKTPEILCTQERMIRAELIAARAQAYTTLMTNVGYARMKIAYEGVLQSFTYYEKEREARECRDCGYDETLITQWPYVFQYATLAGIPLKAAVNEILFKAELRHEAAARIETVRMQHTQKLWHTTDITEIKRIPSDAGIQLFGNMLS